MQAVSDRWKQAHKQTLLNESFVEVSINIADPDALASVTAMDNGAVYISDTPKVVSEIDKNAVPYCTLEQNLWVLDGSRKAIPESDFGENGCAIIFDVSRDLPLFQHGAGFIKISDLDGGAAQVDAKAVFHICILLKKVSEYFAPFYYT